MKKVFLMRETTQQDELGRCLPAGIKQAQAVALELARRGIVFSHFVYDGTGSSAQTLYTVLAALGADQSLPCRSDLDFNNVAALAYGLSTNLSELMAERDAIAKKFGDPRVLLWQALHYSAFARRGREKVARTILKVTTKMGEDSAALVVCHSPWPELAACDPGAVPYVVAKGDIVEYYIDNGRITGSVYTPAPVVIG